MVIDDFQYLNKLQVFGGYKESELNPDRFILTKDVLKDMFFKQITDSDYKNLEVYLDIKNRLDINAFCVERIDRLNTLNTYNKKGKTIHEPVGDKFMELIVLKSCFDAIKHITNY